MSNSTKHIQAVTNEWDGCICSHCGHPMVAKPPQKFFAGEKVRCPVCFEVMKIQEQPAP